MCGRFTQTKTRQEILEQLGGIELPPLFHGRYNVAPSQKTAIIRQQTPNIAEECIWGFKAESLVINARSETLTERPMFRDLLSTNRCLIPADGFYEWKGKQPYYFQTLGKQLFAFAGLWSNGRYVILTRAADGNMQGIHHRMPIILMSNQWKSWLKNFQSAEAPPLTVRPVSPRVNKVTNDDPDCLEPGEIQGELF
ncbi:MAG: SOS response-associated peptidase [Kiritimatiellaceae bacterium]|nr:SOS response-associated peptidase [Kiritimatiellaceae bacterium]